MFHQKPTSHSGIPITKETVNVIFYLWHNLKVTFAVFLIVQWFPIGGPWLCFAKQLKSWHSCMTHDTYNTHEKEFLIYFKVYKQNWNIFTCKKLVTSISINENLYPWSIWFLARQCISHGSWFNANTENNWLSVYIFNVLHSFI